MKTLGELRTAVDGLIAAHGPDTNVDFLFQFGSGRTSHAPVTGYTVSTGQLSPRVRFTVGYARGKDAARPTTPDGKGDAG